jgi:hypothetical protein
MSWFWGSGVSICIAPDPCCTEEDKDPAMRGVKVMNVIGLRCKIKIEYIREFIMLRQISKQDFMNKTNGEDF